MRQARSEARELQYTELAPGQLIQKKNDSCEYRWKKHQQNMKFHFVQIVCKKFHRIVLYMMSTLYHVAKSFFSNNKIFQPLAFQFLTQAGYIYSQCIIIHEAVTFPEFCHN